MIIKFQFQAPILSYLIYTIYITKGSEYAEGVGRGWFVEVWSVGHRPWDRCFEEDNSHSVKPSDG
ncbi:MAG: hypothetical protein ACFHWX_04945 [Bacteroidota bacterium]